MASPGQRKSRTLSKRQTVQNQVQEEAERLRSTAHRDSSFGGLGRDAPHPSRTMEVAAAPTPRSRAVANAMSSSTSQPKARPAQAAANPSGNAVARPPRPSNAGPPPPAMQARVRFDVPRSTQSSSGEPAPSASTRTQQPAPQAAKPSVPSKLVKRPRNSKG